jgi:hypothetical protein
MARPMSCSGNRVGEIAGFIHRHARPCINSDNVAPWMHNKNSRRSSASLTR